MKRRWTHVLRSLTPIPLQLHVRFLLKRHGYLPNVLRPTTLNEKILAKMIFDRSPRLTRVADKLGAYEYVRARVGGTYLPRVHAIWNDPAELTLDPAWGPLVVKATHGSGFVRLVPDPARADLPMLRRTAAQWCRFNYGRTFGEWCYRDIVPRLFAEELIGDGDPDHLVEYKIFCFAGEPRFMKVIRGMKGTPRSYYADLDGSDMGISDGQAPLPPADRTLPADLPEMIHLARRLATDFDLIRVDLYHTGNRICVGELTNYPQAGIIPFHPPGADRELGRYWHRRDMPYLPFGPGSAD